MTASKIIGRETEQRRLLEAYRSKEPELVALYGRRRVGKTFLVRELFRDSIAFELTGLHQESMKRQLENFANALRSHFPKARFSIPSSWLDAFETLRIMISEEPPKRKRKRVLFFDEFPWLETRRSGFLAAFEHFWNTVASQQNDLLVVICGSAASWMIRKVIGSKGGLHNRTTVRIRLEPFSLGDTRKYLERRNVRLEDFQFAQLYMAIGGVPHYLNQIQPGHSAAQNIDRLCFAKDGLLVNEFQQLYAALFENAIHHEAMVRTLAKSGKGLTRSELLEATSLKSGGASTFVLQELIQSGFVIESPPRDNKVKEALYRLVDEYSLFYLNWIETNRTSGTDIWLRKSSGRNYATWCGYAFETLCMKHVPQIKAALGIANVQTQESSWIYRAKTPDDEGAQIDMLIDRADHCTNICEMKFSMYRFKIDKQYASDLERKIRVFRRRTKPSKTVFLTLITAHGLEPNDYAQRLVSSQIQLSQLMS